MSYRIIKKDSGLIWEFYGVVVNEDVINCNLESSVDKDFENFKFTIIHFTDIEDIRLTDQTIRKLARMHKTASEKNKKIKLALVCKSYFIKILANTYKASGGDDIWQMKIFDNIDDAFLWIESTH